MAAAAPMAAMAVALLGGLGTATAASATPKVEWEQTAMLKAGKYDLGKAMPPLTLTPMEAPSGKALSLDRGDKFQTLLGFGGAFTEAAALNWRSLKPADQAEVIRLYFASPADGGLGYTVGRVPINSCDFGPGDYKRYYNFDDVAGDTELKHFDDSVSHDVQSGMIPFIKAAQSAIEKAGGALALFASPWSPPGWMKLPVDGERSMLRTALPNGLDPAMQRPYAHYFSRFISAYKAHGIPIWGVTVQNEAEAGDVGWEKCVWTPEFQAEFVRDHLGPVLHKDQPGVKIIGFDHNKDHVVEWAHGLYADEGAKKYFDGIGVHWYGGLNTHNLENAHAIAPEKFLLATEACNCPGVIYESQPLEWWERAEHLGMDILQDLLHWCTGWVDWNLIVDITGGPNHLGNRCDANLIADPDNKKGYGTIVMQASYYYMGHFSRYLPEGSRRITLDNSVVKQREVTTEDVANGQPLVFLPCSGSELQSWTLDSSGSIFVEKSEWKCIDVSSWGEGPRLDVYECSHSPNQQWERRVNPECSAEDVAKAGVACSQLVNTPTNKCLTKVTVSGAAIGLDAGTSYTVGQALPCKEIGDPSQIFDLVRGDQGGFPDAFPIRTDEGELCLQPYVRIEPSFDAVAFETPSGSVSVVALNKGEDTLTYSLYDANSGLGASEIVMPPHSIQSFSIPKQPKHGAAAASAATTLPTIATPMMSSKTAAAHAAHDAALRPTLLLVAAMCAAIGAALVVGGVQRAITLTPVDVREIPSPGDAYQADYEAMVDEDGEH